VVSLLLSRAALNAVGFAAPEWRAPLCAVPGPARRQAIRGAPRGTAPVFVMPIAAFTVASGAACQRQCRCLLGKIAHTKRVARRLAGLFAGRNRNGMPWIGDPVAFFILRRCGSGRLTSSEQSLDESLDGHWRLSRSESRSHPAGKSGGGFDRSVAARSTLQHLEGRGGDAVPIIVIA
jgi:hypothetical protein